MGWVMIVYTSGTIGDAFVEVCKLYNKAKNGPIMCNHFTRHVAVRNQIAEVFSLLPNVTIEFSDTRSNNLYVTGSFINTKEEALLYDFRPKYHPEFIDVSLERFSLPDNYVVVQLSSGINKVSRRKLKLSMYNTVANSSRTVVLLGTDDIQVTLSDNVIDLRNKTTIKEAVGIIKNADMFYGCQGFLNFVAVSQRTVSNITLLTDSDRMAVNGRILNTPWKKYYKERK